MEEINKTDVTTTDDFKAPLPRKRFAAIAVVLLTLLIILSFFLWYSNRSSKTVTTTTPSPKQTETSLSRIKRLGVLKVGNDLSLLPWGDTDLETGQPIGGEVELARLLGKKLGVNVEFVNRSWDFIIEDLLNKRFDVVMAGMSITEERKRSVTFSDSYLTVGQVLTVKKDSDIKSVSDLQGKTVGVQVATTSEAYAKTIPGIKEVKTYESENVEILYPDVAEGKVDGVIYDSVASYWYVRNNPEANLIVLPDLLTTEDYGVAIRPEDLELLAAINKAISEAKQDPEYQQILDRWYVVNP